MITIYNTQQYTIARFGSQYFIFIGLAPEDATVTGADEIIRAQTDYTFEIETDGDDTVTDQYNNVYALVIGSVFKTHFIAQLPPYITL